MITTIMNAFVMFLAIFLRSAIEGTNLFSSTMFVILLIVAILNFLLAFFGFLGAKNTFFYGNYSLLFGSFLAGIYLTLDFAGWEYFTSSIVIILFSGFGLIIGVIFDLVRKKKDIDRLIVNKVLMVVLTVLLLVPLVLVISDIK